VPEDDNRVRRPRGQQQPHLCSTASKRALQPVETGPRRRGEERGDGRGHKNKPCRADHAGEETATAVIDQSDSLT
jgi:hypothetical protein